jgi:UDPglucose--hexose-1-phosphate uridylyltransferase
MDTGAVRVIPNKFPALCPEGELDRCAEGTFDRMNGIGKCEVIIESPDHATSLSKLSTTQIEHVLCGYRERITALKRDKRISYILIFKNQGQFAGASLAHSHSQLIALPIVPAYVAEEVLGAKQYYLYKNRCVFCDILRQELDWGPRVIAENEDFLTVCPYAPRFPFETWILPKRHESAFEDSASHISSLACSVKILLTKFDSCLDSPPLNFVIHTSPVGNSDNNFYHWHIEFMPRLTQIAGFEWGTGFHVNPTPPEEAAEFLRKVSATAEVA